LKSEIKMRPGEPFSLVEMLEGQRRLQNQAIFRSVLFKPVGLGTEAERIHLFIELEEKKPLYLQLGGGYESEQGWFGRTRFGDRNLFGSNKHAWAGGSYSQIGYRIECGLTEPRLFRSRTSASLNALHEDIHEKGMSFGVRRYGTSLGFNRRLMKPLLSGLTFGYENRNVKGKISLSDSLTEEEQKMAEPRNTLLTTVSLVYDKRNSFIRPKKGMFSSFTLDVSQGIDNPFDDFNKYRWDIKWFLTPLEPLTLASMLRTGFVHARREGQQLAGDRLFYLGGTSTVRGYHENLLEYDSEGASRGAERALSVNLELRLDVGMNFELAGFYDFGQLRHSLTGAWPGSFRTSAGGGLRYITPIGPIGALYGYKLQRRSGESPGAFHFSLGYTF